MSQINERALIGGVLVRGEFPIVDIVPQDFSDSHYASIWAAMCALAKENQPIEYITIRDELTQRGLSYEIVQVFDELADGLPDPANLDWYARKVSSASRFRSLQRETTQIFADAPEFHEAAERITNLLLALQKGDWHGFRKIHSSAVQHLKALESGGISGHRTGFSRLDDYILGLRPGHVYIIGDRPSSGKHMLALPMSRAIARAGHPVAYFLLETSGQQLASRLLSYDSGLTSYKLMQSEGNTKDDWVKIAEVIDGLSDLQFFVDESGDLSVGNIRSRIIRAREEFGASFVVVDYMQLVGSKGDTERSQMNVISTTLRRLSKELEVPILALSQLSRVSVYERPGLHHLKESGNIEADADVVMMIFRHKALAKQAMGYSDLNKQVGEVSYSTGILPDEEIIWVDVAKNRQCGREGLVPLKFDRSTGELKEIVSV